MKEYVGHMKKYAENMKRYVGNMWKIYGNEKNFKVSPSKHAIFLCIGDGTWKNSENSSFIEVYKLGKLL